MSDLSRKQESIYSLKYDFSVYCEYKKKEKNPYKIKKEKIKN